MKLGMLIDLDKCVACQACTIACKAENNVGTGLQWNRVLAVKDKNSKYPNVKVELVPRPCMHCEKPPCLAVCPVGAITKRADGIVMQDYPKCIGCRRCLAACPYGARSFNFKAPHDEYEGRPGYYNPDPNVAVRPANKVEKCTFCFQRVDKDLEPACVGACPSRARTFGDLEDPDSDVARLIQKRKAAPLSPEYGTIPQVFYGPRG